MKSTAGYGFALLLVLCCGARAQTLDDRMEAAAATAEDNAYCVAIRPF